MRKFLTSVGLVLAAAITALALSACGQDSVSFTTLEAARTQATANAATNAANYRAMNPRFDSSFQIIQHGDTSQVNDCPQGDGWATLTMMKVVGKEIEKYVLKCSTVSSNLGCYLDSDFAKKANLASDDGKCQPVSKVPFPLPVLK